MNNIFKGLIAGYGAKKLGGGCLSTVLIFIVIYWALGNFGNCNSNSNKSTTPSRPASIDQKQKVVANNYIPIFSFNTYVFA